MSNANVGRLDWKDISIYHLIGLVVHSLEKNINIMLESPQSKDYEIKPKMNS